MSMSGPVCTCDGPLRDLNRALGDRCDVHGSRMMRDRLVAAEKARDALRARLEAEQRARKAAEQERDEARDWLGAVNAALGEDRDRRAFVDDAVRLVVAERDAAREETRRRQKAIDQALTAMYASGFVGGPSEQEAWQTVLAVLGPFETQYQEAPFATLNDDREAPCLPGGPESEPNTREAEGGS